MGTPASYKRLYGCLEGASNRSTPLSHPHHTLPPAPPPPASTPYRIHVPQLSRVYPSPFPPPRPTSLRVWGNGGSVGHTGVARCGAVEVTLGVSSGGDGAVGGDGEGDGDNGGG